MTSKVTLVALLVLLPVAAAGQDWRERMDLQLSEINAWEPIGGVWTGEYRVKTEPEALAEKTREAGLEDAAVGLRVSFLEGDTPRLAFRFPGQTSFEDVGGTVRYQENTLGWNIEFERVGEVWIEKYVFMFQRLEERRAAMTVTRTVHNWFKRDDEDPAFEYFYAFSTGEVTRSRRGVRPRRPE